jgi:hypothetical protein
LRQCELYEGVGYLGGHHVERSLLSLDREWFQLLETIYPVGDIDQNALATTTGSLGGNKGAHGLQVKDRHLPRGSEVNAVPEQEQRSQP